MVKTFLFATKFKAGPDIELCLRWLSYVCSLCWSTLVILNMKNYNRVHEWSKSFWIPYQLLLGSLIWLRAHDVGRGGHGRKGIYLMCKRAIHLSSNRTSSFGCIACKCVNWTAGLPCGGRRRSSHTASLPLQRPEYEQHQSASPESSARSPLPGGSVSISGVVPHPVNAGHVLVFVSRPYCGNQIKQGRKAVSTNDLGTWGNT